MTVVVEDITTTTTVGIGIDIHITITTTAAIHSHTIDDHATGNAIALLQYTMLLLLLCGAFPCSSRITVAPTIPSSSSRRTDIRCQLCMICYNMINDSQWLLLDCTVHNRVITYKQST